MLTIALAKRKIAQRMSTVIDHSASILQTSLRLEETLTDCISAFREGETRGTFESVHHLAQTRHSLLRRGGYLRGKGRNKDMLWKPGEGEQEYPGPSSQALYALALTALEERDRAIYSQAAIDSKTEQKHKHLDEAAEILWSEFNRLSYPGRPRDTFGPTRGTLTDSNMHPTRARTYP